MIRIVERSDNNRSKFPTFLSEPLKLIEQDPISLYSVTTLSVSLQILINEFA